jgi:hypothetical protein
VLTRCPAGSPDFSIAPLNFCFTSGDKLYEVVIERGVGADPGLQL